VSSVKTPGVLVTTTSRRDPYGVVGHHLEVIGRAESLVANSMHEQWQQTMEPGKQLRQLVLRFHALRSHLDLACLGEPLHAAAREISQHQNSLAGHLQHRLPTGI
jgi:hypothetical protein